MKHDPNVIQNHCTECGEYESECTCNDRPRKQTTINVSIRRDRESGLPVLFFINHDDIRYWIECYARLGQHSDTTREYLQDCAPILHLDAECQSLIHEWRHLDSEDVCLVNVVQRLVAPRGLRRA